MNYPLLIEERKSTRVYSDKPVDSAVSTAVKDYHDNEVMRLVPQIKTELFVAGSEAKEALESAAGYKEFLEGAPGYLILLSDSHDKALINAGYIMEDISLKLNDMGYGACFVTFTDSEAIKIAAGITSEKEVAAILAFGNPQRARKKMHFNFFTMSGISAKEKKQYFAPKKGVEDLLYTEGFGNNADLYERLDSHGDSLWEPMLAASNSPSYMNRQPYAFVIQGDLLVLVALEDEFTAPIDRDLNLGVVMLHVAAAASAYRGNAIWNFDVPTVLGIPTGAEVIASFAF